MKMTFGKHKGLDYDDVPASYLLWLWEQPWLEGIQYQDLYNYIKDNLRNLEEIAAQEDGPDWPDYND